jgi:hypothetical protein
MTVDSPGPTLIRRWSWLHWTAAIAIVFAAHVVLIFIFGARKPAPPVPVQNTPSLSLVDASPGDWLALNNAALFALPGNNGFAASLWAELPPPNLRFKQDLTEQPHWLTLSNSVQMAGLFAAFKSFIKTNRFPVVHFEFNLSPEVAAPATPTQPPIAQQSTLEIDGELAGRRLLSPVILPSWQDADIDAPSIVQVLVNPAGNVVSSALLPQEIMSQGNSWEPPLTHNAKADRWAVEQARSLRFAPLPSSDSAASDAQSRLAIGQLIFNWQTVPQLATNATKL